MGNHTTPAPLKFNKEVLEAQARENRPREDKPKSYGFGNIADLTAWVGQNRTILRASLVNLDHILYLVENQEENWKDKIKDEIAIAVDRIKTVSGD